MQIINDVARRGLIVGWDPLKLGNALSCLATLFVLARRTGVPTIYPFAKRYSPLFENNEDLSLISLTRGVSRERLGSLLTRLETLLETLPNVLDVEGSSFAVLGKARVAGVVWFTQHEAHLLDWHRDDAERHLRTFCRRGNAVVLQGSYWRQYTDMRELAKHGQALRKHLGPLRTCPTIARETGRAANTLVIGLHLRLGDYRIWLDGRFFFDLDAYRAVAERIHRELRDRPHIFHVFSDERIDSAAFGDLPVIVEQGDVFEDFIRLSHCDFVVGPPSTFSTWAAFCGQTKRVVVTRERLDGTDSLLSGAIDIPFPTGSYLPGDMRAGPI